MVCAINTDPDQASTAWVTVDATLHPPGTELALQWGSDAGQASTVAVTGMPDGRSAVSLTLPAAGVAIYS